MASTNLWDKSESWMVSEEKEVLGRDSNSENCIISSSLFQKSKSMKEVFEKNCWKWTLESQNLGTQKNSQMEGES